MTLSLCRTLQNVIQTQKCVETGSGSAMIFVYFRGGISVVVVPMPRTCVEVWSLRPSKNTPWMPVWSNWSSFCWRFSRALLRSRRILLRSIILDQSIGDTRPRSIKTCRPSLWPMVYRLPLGMEQVLSSIPGSVGCISHVHWAYDYLGPGYIWVHMAWHKKCVKKPVLLIL